jgi:lipoate-protein ligase A
MTNARDHWFFWPDTAHDPYFNMAADELLLELAPELGGVLLRVYGWDRPAMSIGRAQRHPAEPAAGVTTVRRPTGGGFVRHDGELTYTVVVPPEHPIGRLSRPESYRAFHAAMQSEFEVETRLAETGSEPDDRAAMQCFVSPSRDDLLSPEGVKYAGAAQRRTRNGILHQGSIRLDVAGGDRVELTKKLLAAFTRHFHADLQLWTVPEGFREQAEQLALKKYASPDWNRHGRKND